MNDQENVTRIERTKVHKMGLSASQARLLTITARKSDCEYESMRLSHQKIALSRDMSCVSAEYQDAINQTKLMFDFYGNGSNANDLTYDMLMSPSALNDFIPMPLTDTSGRVVLSPELARAAKAAGIPREGMAGLPSSDVRDVFVTALGDNGIITYNTANNIKKTTYNQLAGVGSSNFININIEEKTLTEMKSEYFKDIKFDLSDLLLDAGGSNLKLKIHRRSDNYTIGECTYDNVGDDLMFSWNGDPITGSDGQYLSASELSLTDFLNDDYFISIEGSTWDNKVLRGKDGLYRWSVIDKVGSSTFWDALFGNVGNILSTGDSYTDAALNYASQKIIEKIQCLCYVDETGKDVQDYSNAAYYTHCGSKHRKSTMESYVNGEVQDYVGYVLEQNKKDKDDYNDAYGLNLSYMIEAYLTYFAEYMQGSSNSTYNVDSLYDNSNMIDDFFTFNVVTDADTTGNNMQIAGFYDALFNQICTKGWVENDKVSDKDYVQEMLKGGSLYLSSISDDGFYYQDNYSTNSYIKEVADETKIAQAEANYNREKEKINYKESILDMKMKNLDTEISALTTEYDTVKAVITKNIEKSFKRYDA